MERQSQAIDIVAIGDLVEADYNPRILKEEQYKELKKSIKSFGLVQPLIINKYKTRNNVIVGGHARYSICKELGFAEVPVVYVSLTPKKEKELNIRLNKNTGEFDYDALANHFDIGQLTDWGFQAWEFGMQNDLFELPEEVTDDDDNPINPLADIQDEDYSIFELVMKRENKEKLVDKLNEIKKAESFDKFEECLMHLIGEANAKD